MIKTGTTLKETGIILAAVAPLIGLEMPQSDVATRETRTAYRDRKILAYSGRWGVRVVWEERLPKAIERKLRIVFGE